MAQGDPRLNLQGASRRRAHMAQGDPQLNRQENDDARASPEGTHMAQGDVQLNRSKESVEEAAVLGVCRPSSLASGV